MKRLIHDAIHTTPIQQNNASNAAPNDLCCELPWVKGPKESTIQNILNFSKSYEVLSGSKVLRKEDTGVMVN